MGKWLAILLLLLAAPMYAQDGDSTDAGSGTDPVDRWSDFEVGGTADGFYLPLRLGRDRTGLGLRLRGAFGWDDNIFKEDRNEDSEFFMDGGGQVHAGHNFGLFSVGVRGLVAGRMYFGDPDANQWDLKLGGFFKVPYNGGFGFGVSGDILYQQLQTYEIAGPLVRQDDLRASGAIGRAHVGYQVANFLVFELGFTGQTTDFSEERDIRSLDSWTIGTDFGAYIDILGFMQLHPYVAFDYEWFRDQLDRNPDGTEHRDKDKLQLLMMDFGSDVYIDFFFIELAGRAYVKRQDDSAAGFNRYWQYGVNATADFSMVSEIRLTVGLNYWLREYDDRINFDFSRDTRSTLHESYFKGYTELAWNFWEFFHVGARYTYERRISGIDNGGYAANEITVFIEVAW